MTRSTHTEAPGEVHVFHLGHVAHESQNGELDGGNRPGDEALRRQVPQLAEELVALVGEPILEVAADIGRGDGLLPLREVQSVHALT
jgi:hypothetical protein